jgi:hypothetical protein
MVKKSPAVLVFVLEHHTHTPMRRWTTHVQLLFFELLMKMMKAWLCIYASFSDRLASWLVVAGGGVR